MTLMAGHPEILSSTESPNKVTWTIAGHELLKQGVTLKVTLFPVCFLTLQIRFESYIITARRPQEMIFRINSWDVFFISQSFLKTDLRLYCYGLNVTS